MATKIKQQRPERSLKQVVSENKSKGKSASIDKRFTAMKAAGDGDGEFGGIFTPTDEQIAKINEFTRRPVSADEVVCFSTMSCNDMIDRDNDRFTTECVNDFAKLEGALSPVGKSFMVSHDYTKLPVGRIFGVDTKTVDGVKFLTNDVYMPKTESNKDYIENLEYGIYWAVSVGVMLEDSSCSICASPMVGNYWTFCIENGHEKGLYYDPNSEEKDDWGWAEPIDPSNKKAVLCHRDLFSPKDFYELSQCFLGAQYDAQLGKGAMKGIVKAASLAKLPILNLSAAEAEEIPFTHVSDQVREAYAKGFAVSHEDDGTVKWTDDHDLVWEFDPTEDEVMCLGEQKSGDDNNGEEEDNGSEGISEGQDGDADALGTDGEVGVEDGSGLADGAGEGDDSDASSDSEAEVDTNAAGDDDEEESEEDDESEDEDSDEGDDDADETDDETKSLISAVAKANLPEAVVKAVQSAKKDALGAFIKATAQHIEELTPKAVLGEKYISDKRAEAIKWYVKAKQVGKDEGVNVDRINKLLDLCADNIDLIEEVIEEQKEIAQAKFPASVRRSSVERDVNEPQELAEIQLDRSTEDKVRKLHA